MNYAIFHSIKWSLQKDHFILAVLILLSFLIFMNSTWEFELFLHLCQSARLSVHDTFINNKWNSRKATERPKPILLVGPFVTNCDSRFSKNRLFSVKQSWRNPSRTCRKQYYHAILPSKVRTHRWPYKPCLFFLHFVLVDRTPTKLGLLYNWPFWVTKEVVSLNPDCSCQCALRFIRGKN